MKQSLTFTGADVSLFHLAARFYGDASQWLTIARANNLSDPFITGIVTLTIPDADTTASGGVPAQ